MASSSTSGGCKFGGKQRAATQYSSGSFALTDCNCHQKLCNYNLRADLFTSWTSENPGRRFYRCPLRKVMYNCS